jgi:alkaline phosphatase
MKLHYIVASAIAATLLAGCTGKTPVSLTETAPKNVIFFLGDGMGMTTMTAARIYSVGEEGELTLDTLPETAFVKTFSNDAQVTDSAPSMAAYMTGVKMNNDVISMSTNTIAVPPVKDSNGNSLGNNCGSSNGTPVTTLAEIAKQQGLSVGVVTTTRITHATPAATYSHICHRDLENDIAAALVPGGTGYNNALSSTGLDVVLGGGSQFFTPFASGGKRSDGRDLIAEMKLSGYNYVSKSSDLNAIDPTKTTRLFGLFNSSHLNFDLDRAATTEPSLAEMTSKAMDVLAKNNPKGYFLMVEGGRIDQALHASLAKKALQDTVAFDDALKAAIDKARLTDPELKNTTIVVTADHDHTLVLNGYAKRTGKTTADVPGVLGLVLNYVTGQASLDLDKKPYSIIGFGNGENRVNGARSTVPTLDDITLNGANYHHEAAIQTQVGGETHGGTDVFLGAIGKGADNFHGVI